MKYGSFGFFQLFKNIKFIVNSSTSSHPFEGVLYDSIVPGTWPKSYLTSDFLE